MSSDNPISPALLPIAHVTVPTLCQLYSVCVCSFLPWAVPSSSISNILWSPWQLHPLQPHAMISRSFSEEISDSPTIYLASMTFWSLGASLCDPPTLDL